MDDTIAATLYLSCSEHTPERVEASMWLDAYVAETPRELVLALAATGSWEEACVALRVATRDALVDGSLWLELAIIAVNEGVLEAANMIVDAALRVFPDDARLWSAAASLRLLTGDPTGADDACQRAFALDPEAPGAGLAAAALVASKYSSD